MRPRFPEDARPVPVVVNGIVREAQGDVIRSIAEKEPPGLEWDIDLAEGLPEIIAIKTSFREAIYNVLKNAVEATALHRKNKIKLTTGAVVNDKQRFVLITISDTGAGMPKQTLDRIFNPLFTTKPSGTGMGLSGDQVHR